MIEATAGGAALTVNDRVGDHAVTAAVVGEESPWTERMRQNQVPEASEFRLAVVALWRRKTQEAVSGSQFEKDECCETSTSYPRSYGL